MKYRQLHNTVVEQIIVVGLVQT